MIRLMIWGVYKTQDRLDGGHRGADEDRAHREVAGPALGGEGPQEERCAEWHCGQRASPALWIRSARSATLPVATNTAALGSGGGGEDCEGLRHRAKSRSCAWS